MNALNFVPVWTLILGAGIFFYVLLDGFDLGVGILYNFMPDTRSRNLVMNAIAPVWDGNETWLVLGGVAMLAAFPLAFAILIPALYFPILVMLLAQPRIFRAMAHDGLLPLRRDLFDARMAVKQEIEAIRFRTLIEDCGALRVSNRTRFPQQLVLLGGRKASEHRQVRDQRTVD